MRADREKRAASSAEGQKRCDPHGGREKQAAVLRARASGGDDPRGGGQAKAIDTVFRAIHEGNPDPQLLAYQYVQALPLIAQASNKVWISRSSSAPGAHRLAGRQGVELGAELRRRRGVLSEQGAGPTR